MPEARPEQEGLTGAEKDPTQLGRSRRRRAQPGWAPQTFNFNMAGGPESSLVLPTCTHIPHASAALPYVHMCTHAPCAHTYSDRGKGFTHRTGNLTLSMFDIRLVRLPISNWCMIEFVTKIILSGLNLTI